MSMIIATTLWLLGSVLMYYAERENPDEGGARKRQGGSILALFWREAWLGSRIELMDTLRKINMEPENIPLEKENHLPNHHFQGLC